MQQIGFYYRGDELITESDYNRIVNLWGNEPYSKWTKQLPIDQNSDSGIHMVTELLAIIWNTQKLNERDIALRERIQKGLTPSRAYATDYVERNLLYKLLQDALIEYNKIVDEPVRVHHIPYTEFCRLYKLPYNSIMVKVEKQEKRLDKIPNPPRKIEYKPLYNIHYERESIYQENYIKYEGYICNFSELAKIAYKTFPFLGKLLATDTYGSPKIKYIQIYVYDKIGSDNALQNILCFLEDNGVKFI